MNNPKISVIMPVYNGEKYLKEAIESILNQTFKDFEFIIINDGSTDKTSEIIKAYTDPRIRLINQENKGIIYSLNKGIVESRGKYIARMDADDISLLERFEKQYKFLEENPEYGILGTTFLHINARGGVIKSEPVLLKDEDLRNEILIENVFGHGTVMMREAIIKLVGCYNSEALYVEDYDYWVRFISKSKAANLPDVLYLWRDNPDSVSNTKQSLQLKNAQKIQQAQLPNLKKFCLMRIIDLQKIGAYKNTIIKYGGEKISINRKKRFSHIYLIIGYHTAVSCGSIILSLKFLLMSFLIDPYYIMTNRFILQKLFLLVFCRKSKANLSIEA